MCVCVCVCVCVFVCVCVHVNMSFSAPVFSCAHTKVYAFGALPPIVMNRCVWVLSRVADALVFSFNRYSCILILHHDRRLLQHMEIRQGGKLNGHLADV